MKSFQTLPAASLPFQVLSDQMEDSYQRLFPAFPVHRQSNVLGVEVWQQLVDVAALVAFYSAYKILQDLDILRNVAVAYRSCQTVCALHIYKEREREKKKNRENGRWLVDLATCELYLLQTGS